MKKRFAAQWVLSGVLSLGLFLTQSAFAQELPPDDTNAPPTEVDTNYWANLLATYSNNLFSVSQWLHDGITNSDGTAASSMQDLMDLQATTYSTSAAFDWQESARDEALNWADFNGIPAIIPRDDGSAAYLVSREGNVPNYLAPFDLAAAVTVNTTNVWPGGSTGFSLTGTNTTISMWDEASPRLTHSEFGSRVTELDGVTNLSDHSTAVAGELAGVGNNVNSNGVIITAAAKGMSYAAQVQARDFTSDYSEMTGAVGTNHMRLSNHSYGLIGGWYYAGSGTWYWLGYWQIGSQDPRFGNYTADPANLDTIIQNAPTYLSVWAAGNDQSEGPSIQPTNHFEFSLAGTLFVTNAVRAADGDQGGFDTLSQQASAKNNLAVGAVVGLTNGYAGPTNLLLASFSSCGPTDDGRIKPDVVADGVNNWVPVATSDFTYGIGSGTSFAAPSVAGSINLLAQFYKQLHTNSSELLASTLKGLVIETADSGTTNNGPSYRFGWGLMNTRTTATLINQDATNGLKNQIKEVLLPNGQYIQFPVVSAGDPSNPLKVTLCWTDPAGTANAVTNLDNPAPKLVNDLDLRIIAPDGTTNFPWVLNPDLTNRTSAARSAAATTGDDNRNNVEQIFIPNPTSGTYTVNVTHKGTLAASQWASILINGNVAQQPPPFLLKAPLPTATNQIVIGWPAVVGQQYQVQSVSALAASNNWQNVGGIVSARLTNVVVQVPFSSTNAAQFFRVLQVP